VPRSLPFRRRGKAARAGANKRIVVEPEEKAWQRLAVTLAKAAGTAAGAAIVSRLIQARSKPKEA
jgi:hypothetical protein